MNGTALSVIAICAASLLAGCHTSRNSDTAELRHEMRKQLQTARAQLQTSGATPAQLREIDQAIAALDQQMQQLEGKCRQWKSNRASGEVDVQRSRGVPSARA